MEHKDSALARAADLCSPLEHVTPYLAPPLVPAEAKERLVDLARRLPTTSGAMIECRLGRQSPQVDFSLRATKADDGRDALAGFEPVSAGGPSAVWAGVRGFCRLWQQSGSDLDQFVENMWLEFDLPTATPFVPEPCIFFDSIDSGREQAWISSVALATLMPNSLPGPAERNLARCCAARPPGSTVHYIGAMLGRRTHAVRFTLRIGRSEVLPYLRSIGWRGSPSFIREVLDDLPSFASSVVLNLDVGGVVAPGIGLEIQPDTSQEWDVLIDTLVLQRLCTAAQRVALRAWPGNSMELHDQAVIPKVELRPSTAKHKAVAVRRLNHVKLVIDSNADILSKIYLYGGFGWF